jgi:hypothetical protein
MFMFGAYMAGQAAEAFLENMIEKLAESSLLSAIGAPISAAFSALGSFMSSAIAIGMAAFPVILAALLVAAIVFLINNPDIVAKILDFAASIIKKIGEGLATLGRFLLDLFGRAWGLVVGAVGAYVQAVANFWLGLPGLIAQIPGLIADIFRHAFGLVLDIAKHVVGQVVAVISGIIDKVKEALRWLGSLAGPMIGPPGHQIPNPNYGTNAPTSAGGGGGTRMPGGGGVTGVTLVGVNEQQILDMVDRGLFFKLRRSAPALGPG